jgi:hypothetical protein
MAGSFTVDQGGSLTIHVTLKDSAGVTINSAYPGGGYNGSQQLATKVWPGGTRPVSLLANTVWVTPTAGLIEIQLTDEQTATLDPGRYQLLTRLNDAGAVVDAYECDVIVVAAAGGVPAALTTGAITRLPVEIELVERCSAMLLLVGKSTVADGSNPALGSAIGFAAERLGIRVATPGLVTDADLAALDPSQFHVLCDLAEYRVIRSGLNSFAQPDQSAGQSKIQLNEMMKRFEAQAARLEKMYSGLLSIRRNPVLVGKIQYNHPVPNTPGWGLGTTVSGPGGFRFDH